MMMKNTNSIYGRLCGVLSLGALLISAAACSGRLDDQEPSLLFEVTPEVSVDGIGVESSSEPTRSTLVTDITPIQQNGFRLKEYTGDNINNDVKYNSATGKWTIPNSPIIWRKNTEKKFLAFYPLNLANRLTFSSYDAVYKTGFDITTQNDRQDILFACYDGTGDEGRFPLNFTHALAALQFISRDIDSDLTAISSVSIGGFYKKASEMRVNCGTTDCTYSWTGLSDIAPAGTLSQTTLDEKFLLIPGQTFSDAAPLSVTIQATVAGKSQTITGTIKQGTLTAGHVLRYRLNYRNGEELTFSPVSVTAWGSNPGGTAEAEEKNVE